MIPLRKLLAYSFKRKIFCLMFCLILTFISCSGPNFENNNHYSDAQTITIDTIVQDLNFNPADIKRASIGVFENVKGTTYISMPHINDSTFVAEFNTLTQNLEPILLKLDSSNFTITHNINLTFHDHKNWNLYTDGHYLVSGQEIYELPDTLFFNKFKPVPKCYTL